jgi:eukaryotic-like serine/threonine-protein kinase
MSNAEDTVAAPSTAPTLRVDGSARVAERYRVDRLLGVGGMGRVYEAFDEALGEPVALKVLRPELLDSEQALLRFRKEVKLARQVTHRNVARIYDIGEDAGQRFMTMELIDGSTLADLIERSAPLSVDEALRILEPICRGMAAAHEQGIVHRDLKPGNVMLERGGRVVVTDFGLARRGEDGDRLTMGQVLGTPAYMAPEQVMATTVEPPADVYALGLILFEMLTGRRAWLGPSPVMVAAMRTMEDAPRLQVLRPELGAEVSDLVARCLSRDAEDRFSDAGALLQALEDLRGTTSSMRSPPSFGAATSRTRTVAVLPFRNLGGEESHTAAIGLAEDLVDVLSMTDGLRVRHGGSADVDPLQEGKRLGVDVVVSGSIRRRDDMLRLNVRVLGVEDGFQLWGNRFERPIREALELNDTVGEAVANALAMDGARSIRPALHDSRAADLYLELREVLNATYMARFSTAGRRMLKVLDEVAASKVQDPQLLAFWLVAKYQMDSLYGDPQVGPAEELKLQRVLAAGASWPSAWVAKAAVDFYAHRRPGSAVLSLRRAIDLSPSHTDALTLLSFLLMEAGRAEAALEHSNRALWTEPSRPSVRVQTMQILGHLGRWEEVASLAESADAAHWNYQGGLAASRLSWWAGEWLWRDPPRPLNDAGQEASVERIAEAIFLRQVEFSGVEAALARLLEFASPNSRAQGFMRQIAAEAASYLGDEQACVRLAREAVAHGIIDADWIPKNPLLGPVRALPEASELIETVRARAAPIVEAYELRSIDGLRDAF